MTDSILVQPVVMAGGSGTRLWPLSRAGHPKQFLELAGVGSLFQQAVTRLLSLASPGIEVRAPMVVGNEEHRFLVLGQLRELQVEPAALLLEPMGRNTAPAVTLAALAALEQGDDPVLVVVPADQTVRDAAAFSLAMQQAVAAAARGALVVLGIAPDRPETGYGYIRTEARGAGARRVVQFVEKPDLATAQRYLAEGTYVWNAGMFVLRASVWLAAIEQFRPDIAGATGAAWRCRRTDGRFVRPAPDGFAAVPAESVDRAVLERCPGSAFDIRCVPLDAGWNDLGAWAAVWEVAAKDGQGNAQVGDAIVRDSRDTLVHATSRLVAAIGLDGVVVVETPDAVLVTRRECSQDVKAVVEHLGAAGRPEQKEPRKVHRPWGWYDSIDRGPRHQVKHILVEPGASLSLQLHHHRAEHWIVVSGTAEVTVGDQVVVLGENQSTYIRPGQQHRLANRGTVPLEIIEVQSGSYLGEDDIVRFADSYGRLEAPPPA